MSDWQKENKKYQDEQVKALGFDPEKLTQVQIDIMLQPMEAPENYHQDGEITPAQAKQHWNNQMKRAGFTALQIFSIAKKIGI